MSIDAYAVIGHPVAHSLSPVIHRAFAEQTGESISYERIEAPLDGFTEAVEEFLRDQGQAQVQGRGLNVTVPFKGEAARWVSRLDAGAAFAEAVNTIVEDPAGGYVGFNTDGPGLMMDLQRLLPGSEGLNVLLLGAGGAARGVVAPLLDGIAHSLTIANRTEEKARVLADKLIESGYHSAGGAGQKNAQERNTQERNAHERKVLAVGFDALGTGFDLVVNATSAGLTGGVPAIPAESVVGAFCYDMVYGGETAFMRWSRESGAAGCADGLGMLVSQAALAFQLWRGVLPDVAPVLTSLAETS
jgi:shikimate dehydrogenase